MKITEKSKKNSLHHMLKLVIGHFQHVVQRILFTFFGYLYIVLNPVIGHVA